MIHMTDKMIVGIRVIDEQHQMLIRLSNDLCSACSKNEHRDLEEKLRQLKDYAIYHFRSEEAFFEKYQIPDLAEHKVFHERFSNKVDEFYLTLDDPDIESIRQVDLCAFLENWIIQHIMHEDMKMKHQMGRLYD